MKIKPFLEAEHSAQWGLDDQRENRAGRLSAAQRRMLELRLYQYVSAGTVLLGLLLLTVFSVSVMLVYSLHQNLGAIFANGYVLIGLIIPPWLVVIFGYEGLCLMMDLRSGVVKRDCGVARLETRRQAPFFQRQHYVRLGTNRYLLNQGVSNLREGETVCVYYTANMRMVTAVEASTD